MDITQDSLERVFRALNAHLSFTKAEQYHIVVCGGAALMALQYVTRVTRDVDIVALRDAEGALRSPSPLPQALLEAADTIAPEFGLEKGWLNNGPSSDEGGLYQMGLPQGFLERLHHHRYGEHLTVSYVGRIDQICFKLYAAADRGGYHITDLQALKPNDEEVLLAARWSMTHDTSEGYKGVLKTLLKELGYERVSHQI